MRILAVFVFALLTAIATGVGALPMLALRRPGPRWLGVCNALAAGSMAAASVALLLEGYGGSPGRTFGGAAAGIALLSTLRHLLNGREARWGDVRGMDAARILAIMGVMTLHSFTEGVGVGVSFGGGAALGAYITAAIAIHNVPEGLAIALVMVPRGTRVRSAAGWSIVSSLPQPLMAVPAFLLVEHVAPLLPIGLGFAGGAMLWMVVAELMPEAVREASRTSVALSFVVGAGAMGLLQALLA